MQRQIKLTGDGSHTVAIAGTDITYHSFHGAIQESMHVFIEAGLGLLLKQPLPQQINILEIGFGTGLNALLAIREAIRHERQINYVTIELYPLTTDEVKQLNHGILLEMDDAFKQIHACTWEEAVTINPFFTIYKVKTSLPNLSTNGLANAVFFDAFSPTEQPELWTKEIFEKIGQLMAPGALLVTYCSKSIVRKAMQEAGLKVEKIQGPWGKREMIRAWKS